MALMLFEIQLRPSSLLGHKHIQNSAQPFSGLISKVCRPKFSVLTIINISCGLFMGKLCFLKDMCNMLHILRNDHNS